MSLRTQWKPRAGGLVAALALTGCFTAQPNPTLEAIHEATTGKIGKGESAFVEMFVEYAGPEEKWAGPASMILHVSARDQGLAEINISMSTEFASDRKGDDGGEDSVTVNRTLASDRALSAESARRQMADLARVVTESEQKFEGCLSPVRVRLIRNDGSIVEKQGCRTAQGWPGAVSKVVAEFLPLGV